jgi:hypothetical protein
VTLEVEDALAVEREMIEILELKECRWLFRVREIRAGAAPPVHECLIGDTALAAE